MIVGLDGCPGGWVVAVIDRDQPHIAFFEKLTELSSSDVERAGIDMPIGLPRSGYRDCDVVARKMLGSNRSRVFLGARRGVINNRVNTAADLNNLFRAREEPGISLQLWHLRAKLREVDAFVRNDPSCDMREVHPELVFQRLNRDRPVASKKTNDGLVQRRKLLRANGFANIDALLKQPRRLRAKPDDVLDACAAAIAARDFSNQYVLPFGSVPRDEFGLPMQIWY